MAPATRATVTIQQRLVPDPDRDEVGVVHLGVEVRRAYRCSRWGWHLVDRRDGSEFEAGFEYDSSSDARQAGFSRLAELTSSVPDVTRPAVLSLSAFRLHAA